ncbi:P-II family nitrogen regulator [Anthocerotibacter panamensis]|uniref:P-II family nitrogen regulator n=1 Tax=Anthocerotibacter panamensis TaxID=2857077 RepID=UPI001C407609|nr:P-II family nitrogen regulator [Anthocerotibacter panamensis]
MKMIVAVIQPFMLDRVVRALRGKVHGLTCWEVRGFGTEVSQARSELNVGDYFSQKVRLEIVVDDARVQPVMDAIQTLAHTGHSGDGKVFILPVEDALRISTGQTGIMAI